MIDFLSQERRTGLDRRSEDDRRIQERRQQDTVTVTQQDEHSGRKHPASQIRNEQESTQT